MTKSADAGLITVNNVTNSSYQITQRSIDHGAHWATVIGSNSNVGSNNLNNTSNNQTGVNLGGTFSTTIGSTTYNTTTGYANTTTHPNEISGNTNAPDHLMGTSQVTGTHITQNTNTPITYNGVKETVTMFSDAKFTLNTRSTADLYLHSDLLAALRSGGTSYAELLKGSTVLYEVKVTATNSAGAASVSHPVTYNYTVVYNGVTTTSNSTDTGPPGQGGGSQTLPYTTITLAAGSYELIAKVDKSGASISSGSSGTTSVANNATANSSYDLTNITAVPEPATLSLAGLGALAMALGAVQSRRRSVAAI
jgi:hypothetical protein